MRAGARRLRDREIQRHLGESRGPGPQLQGGRQGAGDGPDQERGDAPDRRGLPRARDQRPRAAGSPLLHARSDRTDEGQGARRGREGRRRRRGGDARAGEGQGEQLAAEPVEQLHRVLEQRLRLEHAQPERHAFGHGPRRGNARLRHAPGQARVGRPEPDHEPLEGRRLDHGARGPDGPAAAAAGAGQVALSAATPAGIQGLLDAGSSPA